MSGTDDRPTTEADAARESEDESETCPNCGARLRKVNITIPRCPMCGVRL